MSVKNPYDSPSALKKSQVDFAKFNRVLLNPAFWISLILVIHYGVSLAVWIGGIYLVHHYEVPLSNWPQFFADAWPVCLFLPLSCWAIHRAICARKHTGLLVVAILLASGGVFFFDIAHRNSQMYVHFCTTEYLERGGKIHTYFTWWWYNDGWFR